MRVLAGSCDAATKKPFNTAAIPGLKALFETGGGRRLFGSLLRRLGCGLGSGGRGLCCFGFGLRFLQAVFEVFELRFVFLTKLHDVVADGGQIVAPRRMPMR